MLGRLVSVFRSMGGRAYHVSLIYFRLECVNRSFIHPSTDETYAISAISTGLVMPAPPIRRGRLNNVFPYMERGS